MNPTLRHLQNHFPDLLSLRTDYIVDAEAERALVALEFVDGTVRNYQLSGQERAREDLRRQLATRHQLSVPDARNVENDLHSLHSLHGENPAGHWLLRDAVDTEPCERAQRYVAGCLEPVWTMFQGVRLDRLRIDRHDHVRPGNRITSRHWLHLSHGDTELAALAWPNLAAHASRWLNENEARRDNALRIDVWCGQLGCEPSTFVDLVAALAPAVTLGANGLYQRR